MKKFISVLLAIVMMLGCVPLAFAAVPAGATAVLEVGDIVDGQVSVILAVNNCLDLTSAELKIDYDSSVLEIVPYGSMDSGYSRKVLETPKAFSSARNHFKCMDNATVAGEIKIGFYFLDTLNPEEWNVDADISNIKLIEYKFNVLDLSKDIKLTLKGKINFKDVSVNVDGIFNSVASQPIERNAVLEISEITNGEFSVILALENCYNLYDLDLQLTYDNSVLEFVPYSQYLHCEALDGAKVFDDTLNAALYATNNITEDGKVYFALLYQTGGLRPEDWGVEFETSYVQFFKFKFKVLDASRDTEFNLKGNLNFADKTVVAVDKTCDVFTKVAHTHTIITDAAVAATCTSPGLTEGARCEECGEVLVEQETIEPLGHTEVVIPGYDATCTSTGLADGTVCSVCKNVLTEQAILPIVEHKYSTTVINHTCTTDGYTIYTCVVCNHSYTADIVTANGHNDINADGTCDTCFEKMVTSKCNHMCHATNVFVSLVWKIVNTFNKLFKINHYCDCGIAHW